MSSVPFDATSARRFVRSPMARFLLGSFDQKAVHPALFLLTHDLVTGLVLERLHVRDGSWVGGQHFEDLADLDSLHGPGELDDRKRTEQSATVEGLIRFHGRSHPVLAQPT